MCITQTNQHTFSYVIQDIPIHKPHTLYTLSRISPFVADLHPRFVQVLRMQTEHTHKKKKEKRGEEEEEMSTSIF